MFLKRIEIKGFKSFADRLHIDFNPGITTVVGPNGSGKSNISDSIRWVLGEQSARSLRGARMEDVIFSGSDTRRGLNIAEVTLVLDNEGGGLPYEYSEISVTRRLYRSGESEYLLNRTKCRRKDIIDLFMDSGMGKESFSIIGQGRVEEVLNSRPEERRAMFEEASGVLKYKQRKQEAERKFESTEANLHRVKDILHELNEQMEPLQIQASAAKDYLEKREELESLESALLVHEIEELHSEWKTAQQEEKMEKENNDRWKQKKEETEAAARKARRLEALLARFHQQVQSGYVKAARNLEKREGDRNLSNEQGKHAAEKLEAEKKALEEDETKLSGVANAYREQRDRYEKENEALNSAMNSLQAVQKQLRSYQEMNGKELEEEKSEYIDRLNEQASIGNETRYVTDQKSSLERRMNALKEDNQSFLEERRSSGQIVEKRKKEEESLLQQTENARADAEAARSEEERLEEKLKEQEDKLYKAYRYVDEKKSKIRMLEEMQEEYSGYYQGAKEILKAREQKLAGIIGSVAELIDVPAAYVEAMETALGASLQHIVTRTEKDAREAIAFLRRHQKGRATLLPSETVRPRRADRASYDKARSFSGFIGTAGELVQVRPGYEHIRDQLLGHIFVVDQLETANRLAAACSYKLRIVTLEGDVVNPGGSMSGGKTQNQKGTLLEKQRELRELKDNLSDIEKKTADWEKTVEQTKQAAKKQKETAGEKQQKALEYSSQLEEKKEMRRKSEQEHDRLDSRLGMFDREYESLEEEKERLEERLQVLEGSRKRVEKTLSELKSSIDKLEQEYSKRDKEEASLREQETDEKVRTAALRENVSAQQKEKERLHREKEELEQAVAERKERAVSWEEHLNNDRSGHDWDQLVKEASNAKAEIERLQERINDQKARTARDAEQIEATASVQNDRYQESRERLHETTVRMNRLDVALENKITYLQSEYELSFERAKQKHTLAVSAEQARNEVHLLQLGIEELGTVNLGAIDECERVTERHRFLNSQQEDLMEARESLQNVIDEMDAEVTERFAATYHAIRAEFQHVFVKLFGGGEADLVLTEPENLLHTGVDISARPPGKKKQHLSLLSGGEKALTAIALLFAIIKVKPAPFCVLDEVEAALDEANLVRFAKYLRSFSETTQFIVISHRKATMEEADVLYGITMEESGVSKMVSVRLEEADELLEV
ncbi:chromosome segregation protein SMC [Marinococcus halophilus]|uniref:Chromosome partition protein Smc n=1 Tax=Marinococcus halophilus TaxID=1371 RepID=A0A510Y2E5_MARHA|nr:chromosome segregation protein SMC [Marinococcus halophilus]GEK57363.1 chromosome partition protein Smc [Marinococcus halophilus]